MKPFAGFQRAGAFAAALLFVVTCAATSVWAAAAVDPTKAGKYAAKFNDYRFAAKVDPLVTNLAVTEIWGRIWYPSNKTTKSPLVVILHGNHGTCGRKITGGLRWDDRTDYSTTGKCPAGYVVTPNHAGYDYVAQRLASNGYIVVSINANRGITAHPESPKENDPGLIQRRGRMILRHMMLLSQWNKSGGQPNSIKYSLKNRIDFSKVTIMGHSRGGDAVVAAYNLYKTNAGWRTRVPGVKFVGVAPLAPTDFQVNSPNVIGAPLAVLLPMCDGDVNRLSGIHFYDRSVLAATPDTKNNYKAVFGTWGANHNGYNTQWQVDDQFPNSRTCPNQVTKLFPTAGLVPSQQSLGRYYLMGFARGNSEAAAFDQLFNPFYVLPAGVNKETRVERSFFAGRGPASKLLFRFTPSSCSKVTVTQPGVVASGFCSTLPEHNNGTAAAVVRWGAPASTTVAQSYAQFLINANLKSFTTLDLRVAPDCVRTGSGTGYHCSNTTQQAGGTGSQNIGIALQDAKGKFSKTLLLSNYTERRQALGSTFTGQSPATTIYHALFSSARIPLKDFQQGAQSGFNLGAVSKIWLVLAQQAPTGGLFLGDIRAVSVAANVIQDQKQLDDGEDGVAEDESIMSGDAEVITVADGPKPEPLPTPRTNLPTVPAQSGSAGDGPAQPERAEVSAAADPGNRILAVERTTLAVKTGETSDDAEAARTRTAGAVAFTVATPKQIVEKNAGMSIRIGNTLIPARLFATGRENDTPSVIKLVVPAEAVDAATDGAALVVINGGEVYRFGPFAKSAIK